MNSTRAQFCTVCFTIIAASTFCDSAMQLSHVSAFPIEFFFLHGCKWVTKLAWRILHVWKTRQLPQRRQAGVRCWSEPMEFWLEKCLVAKRNANFSFRRNPASHQLSLSLNMVFRLRHKITSWILSFNKSRIFITIQDKMSANMFSCSCRCACTSGEHSNYVKLFCGNLRLLSIAPIIDG